MIVDGPYTQEIGRIALLDICQQPTRGFFFLFIFSLIIDCFEICSTVRHDNIEHCSIFDKVIATKIIVKYLFVSCIYK